MQKKASKKHHSDKVSVKLYKPLSYITYWNIFYKHKYITLAGLYKQEFTSWQQYNMFNNLRVRKVWHKSQEYQSV